MIDFALIKNNETHIKRNITEEFIVSALSLSMNFAQLMVLAFPCY